MGIVKTISDYFKSAKNGSSSPVDKYDVMSAIMSTAEYVKAGKVYLDILKKDKNATSVVTSTLHSDDNFVSKAIEAYKLYQKGLSPHDQSSEKKAPFSTVELALINMERNLVLIEDHFSEIFGEVVEGTVEPDTSPVKISTLFISGYIEVCSEFVTWLGRLYAHLIPTETDSITPYWSKTMIEQAKFAGEFASNNIGIWNYQHKGLLEVISKMHKKGLDASVRTGSTWVDDLIHDNQFLYSEQDVIIAGIRSTIMMFTTGRIAMEQRKIALLSDRKDWLISKIALEEARLSGMDPDTPQYKKLKKAVEYYAKLVSEHEQKIERLRE